MRPIWQTVSLVALLVFCVALFSALGVWQVHRLAWKQNLISTVNARVQAEPVPIPTADSWDVLDVDSLVYQRVTTSGVFNHEAEVQALAVTVLGPGYWVLTPLVLASGEVVVVNRGFVPQELREPETRAAQSSLGLVNVTGLLRKSEPKGAFLRDNDPVSGRWYSRDTQAIGDANNIKVPVAPFFIDAGFPGDVDGEQTAFPRTGLTVISFRNTHLAYALTWFALALMSCLGLFLVLRDWRRSKAL